jgi:putative ATP-dependent endonuclease of OLD family
MKLAALSIRNFRTINSLDLKFPTSYSALCGPNDSGKTNVVNAIRALIRSEEDQFIRGEEEGVSLKDDFPKWLDTPEEQRAMGITCRLEVNRNRDAGIYQFLVRQLQLGDAPELLTIELIFSGQKATAKSVSVLRCSNIRRD